MANIQISEDLAQALEDAANRTGRTKDELAQEILAAHLEDESLPLAAFTDAQLQHIDESIAQLDRGQRTTSEQVDLKFKAFFEKLAAR